MSGRRYISGVGQPRRAVIAVADAQGPDVSMVALRPSAESHDFCPTFRTASVSSVGLYATASRESAMRT